MRFLHNKKFYLLNGWEGNEKIDDSVRKNLGFLCVCVCVCVCVRKLGVKGA